MEKIKTRIKVLKMQYVLPAFVLTIVIIACCAKLVVPAYEGGRDVVYSGTHFNFSYNRIPESGWLYLPGKYNEEVRIQIMLDASCGHMSEWEIYVEYWSDKMTYIKLQMNDKGVLSRSIYDDFYCYTYRYGDEIYQIKFKDISELENVDGMPVIKTELDQYRDIIQEIMNGSSTKGSTKYGIIVRMPGSGSKLKCDSFVEKIQSAFLEACGDKRENYR